MIFPFLLDVSQSMVDIKFRFGVTFVWIAGRQTAHCGPALLDGWGSSIIERESIHNNERRHSLYSSTIFQLVYSSREPDRKYKGKVWLYNTPRPTNIYSLFWSIYRQLSASCRRLVLCRAGPAFFGGSRKQGSIGDGRDQLRLYTWGIDLTRPFGKERVFGAALDHQVNRNSRQRR